MRATLYSDAGLFLAQLATEEAVGEPWWDFMRRELFAPAGMNTVRSMSPGALIPHRVAAYTLDEGGTLVRDRRLDVDYGPLYSDLGSDHGGLRALACRARSRCAPVARERRAHDVAHGAVKRCEHRIGPGH